MGWVYKSLGMSTGLWIQRSYSNPNTEIKINVLIWNKPQAIWREPPHKTKQCPLPDYVGC